MRLGPGGSRAGGPGAGFPGDPGMRGPRAGVSRGRQRSGTGHGERGARGAAAREMPGGAGKAPRSRERALLTGPCPASPRPRRPPCGTGGAAPTGARRSSGEAARGLPEPRPLWEHRGEREPGRRHRAHGGSDRGWRPGLRPGLPDPGGPGGVRSARAGHREQRGAPAAVRGAAGPERAGGGRGTGEERGGPRAGRGSRRAEPEGRSHPRVRCQERPSVCVSVRLCVRVHWWGRAAGTD